MSSVTFEYIHQFWGVTVPEKKPPTAVYPISADALEKMFVHFLLNEECAVYADPSSIKPTVYIERKVATHNYFINKQDALEFSEEAIKDYMERLLDSKTNLVLPPQ